MPVINSTVNILKQTNDVIDLMPTNGVTSSSSPIHYGSGAKAAPIRCKFWRIGQMFYLSAVINSNGTSGTDNPLFVIDEAYAPDIDITFDTCGFINLGTQTFTAVPICITGPNVYIQSAGGFTPPNGGTARFSISWTAPLDTMHDASV